MNYVNSINYSERIINKEELEILVNVLKNYEQTEDYIKSGVVFNLSLNVKIEELAQMLNANPILEKYINFDIYSDEQLVYLVNTLPHFKEIDKACILKFAGKESLKDIKKKCEIDYLRSLTPKELEKFSLYNFSNCFTKEELFSVITSSELSREERLELLKNKYIAEVVANIYIYSKDALQIKVEEFIKEIDSDGRLLELYHSLTEEKLNKLKEKGVTYDNEIKLKEIQYNFLKNIAIIETYKDQLSQMIQRNPNLLYTINFNLLQFMNPKSLEILSKYDRIRDISLEKLAYSKGHIEETTNLLQERLNHPEEEIYKLLELCSKFESEDIAKEFWNRFSPQEAIYLAGYKNRIFSHEIQYINDATLESMKNISIYEEERFRKIIDNPSSTKEEVLDVYMHKFFGTSLEKIREQVEIYGSDLPKIIKHYTSKETLTDRERIELYSLKHIQYIKEIINIEDVGTLRNLFEELSKDPELKPNIIANLMINDYLKVAYTKEKNESLYALRGEDIIKRIVYDKSSIPVYKPTQDFNMLITIVGAYIKSSSLGEHPYAEWNDKEKNTSKDICTSIIGNDNLSMASNKDNIKFGFIGLRDSDIREEAPYDLSSNANTIIVNTLRESQFKTTQGIKDCTRYGHNEILLERQIVQEDGTYVKRQPDYIVAINKITTKDKRAAKEFGIPIVYIDTREIAKCESERIRQLKDNVIQDTQSSPRIDFDVLKELFTKYHNNYSGLFEIDKRSLKRFFKPQEMEDYLISIAKYMVNIKDEKDIERFYQMLEEEHKREGIDGKRIPFTFNKIRATLGSQNKTQTVQASIKNTCKVQEMQVSTVKNVKGIYEQIDKISGGRDDERQ